MWTCLSAIFQKDHGRVIQVVLRNAGWTKSVTTTNDHQPKCGEALRGAVIEEWRNGPWRLRANNDDDDESLPFYLFEMAEAAGLARPMPEAVSGNTS